MKLLLSKAHLSRPVAAPLSRPRSVATSANSTASRARLWRPGGGLLLLARLERLIGFLLDGEVDQSRPAVDRPRSPRGDKGRHFFSMRARGGLGDRGRLPAGLLFDWSAPPEAFGRWAPLRTGNPRHSPE